MATLRLPIKRRVYYISALQPVCTVHPGVHQNMRGVHHYERVHKGASQTCHLKRELFLGLSCWLITCNNKKAIISSILLCVLCNIVVYSLFAE